MQYARSFAPICAQPPAIAILHFEWGFRALMRQVSGHVLEDLQAFRPCSRLLTGANNDKMVAA